MDTNMFHEGDLNSGIARAIRERKVVACFVRQDEDYWSQVWEDYWLANKSQPTDMISADEPPLGLIVGEKAVLLRLEMGSKEADFLKAFVQLEKAPTLVVIQNGTVLEKLEGGVGREEFTRRFLKAVGFEEGKGARQAEVFNGDEEVEEEELVDDIGGLQTLPGADTSTPTTAGTATTQPTLQATSQPSANLQSMLNDRAQRLEAERLKREAAEKAERMARANARRRESEEATAANSGKGKQRATTTAEKEKQQARDVWIYQQKQRKDEAKKERERILGQIESDKQERKAQALRRKEMESTLGGGAYTEMTSLSEAASTSAKTIHSSCTLVVRLFDGTSIRGKFASDGDIATAVRTWVKEAAPEGGADIPYNFRQILAPAPSRTIEVSEEHKSLQELGLVPNATLVLVPIAGATSAYGSAAGGGYMSSAWTAAYYVANSTYGLVGSVWSYVPGFGTSAGGPYMGGTGDEQEASNVEGARMADTDSASPGGNNENGASSVKMRVKTLADQQREQERRKPTEYYNGNSSAFEGRKDNEDE